MRQYLSSLFDPIPVYSLVFLRVSWGIFGYTKPLGMELDLDQGFNYIHIKIRLFSIV